MLFYEEYTLLENLLSLVFLYIPALFAYFVFKPFLLRLMEKKRKPIEEGTDAPDEEYWRDELPLNKSETKQQ
ncbi:MAG: hypothetical protein ACXADL_11645 [Candidatus Thorarchaeota archaeon]|jgi:hypothetical protein